MRISPKCPSRCCGETQILVEFHPEAKEELAAAAEFYEDRVRDLGLAFLAEVEKSIRQIARAPKRWPVLSGAVRRFLLKRFPYGILYALDDGKISILAVMHLHRKPNYWEDRT